MPVTADPTAPTTVRADPPPTAPPWVAMYHSVDDCSDDPYRITVSPRRLDRQLRRHGCGAALFVLPGRLDDVSSWAPLGPRKRLLGKRDIRTAAATEGTEIGSHGPTHVDLTRADDRTLRAEAAGSRAVLAELTGAPVLGFCHPYGSVDRRVAGIVRDSGCTYASTVDKGPLTGPYALPRVRFTENRHRLHRLHRSHWPCRPDGPHRSLRPRRRPVEEV